MLGKVVKLLNSTTNNSIRLPSEDEARNEETGGSGKALSQKDEVGPLLKKPLKKGDLWYVICD